MMIHDSDLYTVLFWATLYGNPGFELY